MPTNQELNQELKELKSNLITHLGPYKAHEVLKKINTLSSNPKKLKSVLRWL